jgi:hypothetical protein
MCAPDPVSYLLVTEVLKTVLAPLPLASLHAMRDLVWALLRAQSLHPADLARALPDLQTRRARQALRRVRRSLGRAALGSTALTPLLLRAALRLIPAAELLLVLDSTRCRRWELFTLGLGFHGRVLPIAWALLPYPWPKGQFTPTVVALLDATLAHWPVERPLHLVADRGFPSLKFFACLARWQTQLALGATIRLRAGDWVRRPDGAAVKVADLEADLALDQWRVLPACYQQRGRGGPAMTLVVGRGEPEVPRHQRGPADTARRAARAAARLAYLRSKRQPHAAATDRVWALLTTAPTAGEAVAYYRQRFPTEPTYRDLKSWELEAVAGQETSATHLDGLVGLAALGYLLQAALGAAAGQTDDASARARQAQWSTTDRLSVFWRGRQVLHDRAHDWQPWLATLVAPLRAQLAPAAPIPLRPRATALPEAA